MKHYLVIGRICGDDEDTHLPLQIESREAAIDAFIEFIWDAEGIDANDRLMMEANGEGAFVNGVFESDTEIKESE